MAIAFWAEIMGSGKLARAVDRYRGDPDEAAGHEVHVEDAHARMRPDRRQRPVYEVNGPEALAAEALLRTPLGQADPNHHRRRPGPAGLLPEHRRVRVVRSRHGELEPSGERRIRGPAGEALRFSSQVPQPGCAQGLAVLEPHVSGHRT